MILRQRFYVALREPAPETRPPWEWRAAAGAGAEQLNGPLSRAPASRRRGLANHLRKALVMLT